ncbi:hypothetical protein CP532_6642 [Ophiocordyceps camponoti-leonardi (nom. inval.)]|nr:hypothetical protein CP532_6642 [Ophiocordyceps camponoti-leonardi (nom. inval.)]
MAIATFFDLEAHQYDFVNAFCNSDLDEEVYCKMPPGSQTRGRLLTKWLKDQRYWVIYEDPCVMTNGKIIIFFYVDDLNPDKIDPNCRDGMFAAWKTVIYAKTEEAFEAAWKAFDESYGDQQSSIKEKEKARSQRTKETKKALKAKEAAKVAEKTKKGKEIPETDEEGTDVTTPKAPTKRKAPAGSTPGSISKNHYSESEIPTSSKNLGGGLQSTESANIGCKGGESGNPHGGRTPTTYSSTSRRPGGVVYPRFGDFLPEFEAGAQVVNPSIRTMLPPGFQAKGRSWRLKKALYGLRRSPLLWFKLLSSWLKTQGYRVIYEDPCVMTNGKLIIFFYVDDLVALFRRAMLGDHEDFKEAIDKAFQIKHLGDLKWFLNLEVIRDRSTRQLWLSQRAYVQKFSKSCILIPGNDTMTAAEWATALHRHLLQANWGIPSRIISDRDPKFISFHPPLLVHFEPQRQTRIETDASDFAMSGILFTKRRRRSISHSRMLVAEVQWFGTELYGIMDFMPQDVIEQINRGLFAEFQRRRTASTPSRLASGILSSTPARPATTPGRPIDLTREDAVQRRLFTPRAPEPASIAPMDGLSAEQRRRTMAFLSTIAHGQE